MKNNSIAIIGGVGPQASAYMYKLLIDMAQKEFAALNNDDFPEIILYSLPVPDFISNKKNKQIALGMLKECVKRFNNIDVSTLAIACNTAHVLLPELEKISKQKFISMIDEVAKQVKQSKTERIGILGTPSTINSRLYQIALSKYKIESIIPNKKQQTLLDKIIRNVLANKIQQVDLKQLISIADSLRFKGANGIVLGCTELPLIFPSSYPITVYSSTAILSRALLRKYYE
jgi:aspartate racemase